MTAYELNHRIVKENGDIRLEEIAYGTKAEVLEAIRNLNPTLLSDYEVSWKGDDGYDHDNVEDWLHFSSEERE